MKTIFKIFKTLTKITLITGSVLFAVYFWNLDQKLMAALYKLVNGIFDRKKVDIKL